MKRFRGVCALAIGLFLTGPFLILLLLALLGFLLQLQPVEPIPGAVITQDSNWGHLGTLTFNGKTVVPGWVTQVGALALAVLGGFLIGKGARLLRNSARQTCDTGPQRAGVKPVTKRWPFFLFCLSAGCIGCLAAVMLVPARVAAVFMVFGAVLFVLFPILALVGLIRSAFCLASRDCRRKTGLGIPCATILIALIGGFGILMMASWLVVHRIGQAQVIAARMQLNKLDDALRLYTLDCGAPPTAGQGLAALITNPGVSAWRGPYLPEGQIPLDPWMQAYRYRLKDGKAFVDSAGPDLVFDTDDDVLPGKD